MLWYLASKEGRRAGWKLAGFFAARGIPPRTGSTAHIKSGLYGFRGRHSSPRGNHENFVLIYKFKHIKWIAALSRMKLAQTGFVLCLSCAMFYLASTGDTTWNSAVIVSGFAALAVVVLFLISHFSRRLIGYAWLNRPKDAVKIAHLTFWGGRCDRTYPITSIAETDLVSQNRRDVFQKLKIVGSPEFYYFSLRGCHVPERRMFTYVFGKPCYDAYRFFNRST